MAINRSSSSAAATKRLYERMILIPENQYYAMTAENAKFVDSINGNIDGQVNHIEVSDGGRVVIKPDGALTAAAKKPPRKRNVQPPPTANNTETVIPSPPRVQPRTSSPVPGGERESFAQMSSFRSSSQLNNNSDPAMVPLPFDNLENSDEDFDLGLGNNVSEIRKMYFDKRVGPDRPIPMYTNTSTNVTNARTENVGTNTIGPRMVNASTYTVTPHYVSKRVQALPETNSVPTSTDNVANISMSTQTRRRVADASTSTSNNSNKEDIRALVPFAPSTTIAPPPPRAFDVSAYRSQLPQPAQNLAIEMDSPDVARNDLLAIDMDERASVSEPVVTFPDESDEDMPFTEAEPKKNVVSPRRPRPDKKRKRKAKTNWTVTKRGKRNKFNLPYSKPPATKVSPADKNASLLRDLIKSRVTDLQRTTKEKKDAAAASSSSAPAVKAIKPIKVKAPKPGDWADIADQLVKKRAQELSSTGEKKKKLSPPLLSGEKRKRTVAERKKADADNSLSNDEDEWQREMEYEQPVTKKRGVKATKTKVLT